MNFNILTGISKGRKSQNQDHRFRLPQQKANINSQCVETCKFANRMYILI